MPVCGVPFLDHMLRLRQAKGVQETDVSLNKKRQTKEFAMMT